MMRQEEVGRLARGHWYELLIRLGVDAARLTGQHVPCPVCGGRDRFRFDDHEQRGTFYCNQPQNHGGKHAGDGFKLLMDLHGWDFRTAAQRVRALLGVATAVGCRTDVPGARPRADPERLRARLRKTWRGSAPVAIGDPVATYLACRGVGLEEFPRVLRTASALPYWHKLRDANGQLVPRKLDSLNAMLALVQGPDSETRTLHATYIAGGRKAGVPKPRKFLSALAQLSGAAVRLYAPGETLAIAEGIETALAVRLLTGLPVWAALNERLMRSIVLPAQVRRVHIFADRDLNGVGEEAARELGERMQREGRAVRIALPRKIGEDFLDVLNRRPDRAAA